MKFTVFVAALALALPACKRGTAPESQSADDELEASLSEGGDDPEGRKLWQDKTRHQRVDWMGTKVLPQMKALFLEYDQAAFADIKCQTCHGETMEMLDYHMPGVIFSLSAEDPIGEAAEYDPQMTEFMAEVVLPKMAELLDMNVYDPETQEGLSCFDCHPAAQ